jgi:RyR domain-containing protein
MTPRYTPAEIAQVCHEATRTLRVVQGDPAPPPPWAVVPIQQAEATVEGVEHIQRGVSPDELHEAWTEKLRADGWTHGTVFATDIKTHPHLVPYDELPVSEHDRDEMFTAIVDALSDDRPIEFDTDGRDPETAALTTHFGYAHLPDDLAAISRACATMAALMFNNLPDDPELRAGLRSLLQAKDAFVRTAVMARGTE